MRTIKAQAWDDVVQARAAVFRSSVCGTVVLFGSASPLRFASLCASSLFFAPRAPTRGGGRCRVAPRFLLGLVSSRLVSSRRATTPAAVWASRRCSGRACGVAGGRPAGTPHARPVAPHPPFARAVVLPLFVVRRVSSSSRRRRGRRRRRRRRAQTRVETQRAKEMASLRRMALLRTAQNFLSMALPIFCAVGSILLKVRRRCPFHFIPFHSIPFHSIPFHFIPFHSIPVQYSTVQYSAVQYSTVQCGTVRYSAVRYSTVQYITSILKVHRTADYI